MHRSTEICQRWRTFALACLCGTAFLLQLTAASQSEGETEQDAVLKAELCDTLDASENMGGRTPACDLKQRLTELPEQDLEGLLAFYKDEKADVPKEQPAKYGKAYAWKLFFFAVSKTFQKSLIREILKLILKKHHDHKCYEVFGCFYPTNRMALSLGGPVPPNEASMKFYYYTNSSRSGKEITMKNWKTVTDRVNKTNVPLTVIIHGFKESKDTIQVVELRNAILDSVESEVIVVDWPTEAKFPYYGAAATNSPLIGAETSVLLQSMEFESSLKAESVHLIGFSVGAQAAGFCGRHFEAGTGRKLGWISGLDPAGLLFEYTNVSLSASDALFVDIIHTNGGDITDLKFGMMSPVGHVDFYPNGGSVQPQCKGDSSKITCSHNAAWWLYIESIRNKTCPFTAITCKDYDHYEECLRNNTSKSTQMGFYSKSALYHGIYYLETNSHRPYCISQGSPREENNSDNGRQEGRKPR